MAEDTNIDDILRSIDALLKESEPDEGHKRAGATNDDEPTEASDDAREAPETDDQSVEAGYSAAADADDEPADESAPEHEAQEADEHQDEAVQALEDEAGMAQNEHDLLEAPEEQHAVNKGRRIMLSEAMLVEDSLDLPLSFSSDSDAQVDEAQGFSPALDDGGDDDESLSWQSGSVDEDGGDSASMDAPGLDDLIESISADIQARLSRELPLLLAPLIAQSVKQHLEGLGKSQGTDEEIDE